MAIVDGVAAGLSARSRGATIVQLRAPRLSTRSLEEIATRLVRAAGLPLVISRRADVALAAGAAGVNLPEDDLSVASARRFLGPGALIGRSVHDLPGAMFAVRAGASYLLFGPVFMTPTHRDSPGAGLATLAEVSAAAGIPVLAVGGVDAANIEACLRAGAAGHAAIRLYA